MKAHKRVLFTSSFSEKVLKRLGVFPLLERKHRRTGSVSFPSNGSLLLPLQYDNRATVDGFITYRMRVTGRNLQYNLYPVVFPDGEIETPACGPLCLSCHVPLVRRGDILQVNITAASASINGQPIKPTAACQREARKYIAEITLSSGETVLSRRCSHYLPFDRKPIGRDYYFGDDYVDYPRHTNINYALNLVKRYCAGGRLLDVGCALGIYTAAFFDAGFDSYGVDISEFAINQAGARVGHDRVRRCDLDAAEIPFDPPFDAFWVWDVLEHSADPRAMLRKLTEKAGRGSFMFLHTANADSLMHRIQGPDWEGYSDYSHYGVDEVSASSLRAWLRELNWDIVEWDCSAIWVSGVDPVLVRLREVFHATPELSTLLSERDLGDMILIVARKR